MGSCRKATFECSSFYVKCKKSGKNFVKLGRGRLKLLLNHRATRIMITLIKDSSFLRKSKFCSPRRRPRKITLTKDAILTFSSYTRTWWNPFSSSGGTGFRCTFACHEFAGTSQPSKPTIATVTPPTPATNSSTSNRCGRIEMSYAESVRSCVTSPHAPWSIICDFVG